MPLFEMSPNVQERETLGRKRSHDEYADDAVKTEQTGTDDDLVKPTLQPTGNTLLPPITHSIIQSSPSGSPCLTEGGSSTPAQNSPSPQTPTKSTTDSTSQATAANAEPPKSANPAAKRKKLTADEKEAKEKELLEKKEAKEKELAEKKREREEKAAQKAAEKAKLEEEKAIKAKEREEKRKKKEEEERKKADEREEKKRQKEEEQQRIQDEKDKKLRSQPKLSSFFAAPKTPKKATLEATSKSESPLKTEVLATTEPAGDAAYRKRFQEFFIRDNVTVAKLGPQMDDETRLAKAAIVDECIAGHRSDIASLFNPCQLLALPHPSRRRGKLHQSVKHVMEVATNSTAQNNGHQDLQAARKQLEKVPLKIIAFSRDVRPPYYGTLTSRLAAVGQAAMVKQCKNSAARVLPLDYDYDSEAEWQEDEGEDLELDDEEEELDDEDDLDGFLDDSEDSGLSRSIFANTMEPDCTGVCFEDENRTTPEYSLRAFKMEMINKLSPSGSIDPFSTAYWEPEVKPSTVTASDKMPPPPTPANAFAAISGYTTATTTEQVKLVKKELLNDVKKAILDNKALSKVGIIDYIFQQFRDNVSRTEVKNTLELVAEKKGTGRSKEWDLKPGHEIVS